MVLTGIDIVDVKRIKEDYENIERKVFCAEEIEYANKFENPYVHLAGIYAAKEAIRKVYSGRTPADMKRLRIGHTPEGEPFVYCYRSVSLSISHTEDLAVAVAVLVRED